MDFDIAYYEFYDCQEVDNITFVSESGKTYECSYYIYIYIMTMMQRAHMRK